ncbi:hypothetical protein Tco_1097695, partial [Tanacetum coccineum]
MPRYQKFQSGWRNLERGVHVLLVGFDSLTNMELSIPEEENKGLLVFCFTTYPDVILTTAFYEIDVLVPDAGLANSQRVLQSP